MWGCEFSSRINMVAAKKLKIITSILFIDKQVSTRHTIQPTLSLSDCSSINTKHSQKWFKILQFHFTHLGLVQIRYSRAHTYLTNIKIYRLPTLHNKGLIAREPVFGIYEQYRSRPAFAFCKVSYVNLLHVKFHFSS